MTLAHLSLMMSGLSFMGQGTGLVSSVHLLHSGSNMNVDTLHAALGIAFTAVWLLVGQILVAGR